MKKVYNLLPGPSDFIDKYSYLLCKTPISQRSKEFVDCWFYVKDKLKLFLDNPYGEIAPIASSATGAMEAAIVSLSDKDSRFLVISTGKFGDRFYEILQTYNIFSKKLSFFEYKKVNYELIEEELSKSNYTHLAFQICETSSGIFTNPQKIGEIAAKHNIITIADAVSAFLADDIYQHLHKLDVIILGSQKGLNAPAGSSFISLSPKAIDIIKNTKIQSYYFNLNRYLYAPPFTPTINTFFYIKEILNYIEKLSIKSVIYKNQQIAKRVRDICLSYELYQYPKDPSSAVSVIEFKYANDFIDFCKNKYNLLIAKGQGSLKGKVFRIGHFGLTPSKSYDIFLLALENFIKKFKAKS